MDRRLVIIAGCGILLIAALIVSLSLVASKSSGKSPDSICLTPECTIEASRVLQAMNRTAKPCDDFYKFACGGFETSTTTQAHSTFFVVNEKLQEQLRLSIEEPSSPDELRTFRLVKDFYNSCMNTSAKNHIALENDTLLKVLEALGGWPVLKDDWNADAFNWSETIKTCSKLGYCGGYLIDVGIVPDTKNNTKRILQLDQATPILSPGPDNATESAYRSLMVALAGFLGANLTTAIPELEESLQFEKELANISWSDDERRNLSALYNPMPISELNKRYQFLNWESMFNSILPPSVRVGTDDIVNVRVPSYLRDFEEIMKRTSNRTVANYVLWKVVQNSVPGLNAILGQHVKAKGTKIIGEVTDLRYYKAHSQKCVAIVSDQMGIGVGALYVRNHFNGDTKEKALGVFSDLQAKLKEIFKQAEWIDEKTRTSALAKVESMQKHIAYPDEFLDDKKLEEFYANLTLTSNDLLQNTFNLRIFHANYEFGLLNKPNDRTDWIAHGYAAIVNAFYTPQSNSIIVPAGILQGSFFSNDRPQYMNYGSIGYVVGHEIIHGFDNTGSQFDEEGNFVDWWDPETKSKYGKKTECLVHQYGNYTAESVNLTLDGSKTLGENIADNGGLKLAYLGYKKLVKTNGAEPKLPGLDYTPEQMFWISAANTWCTKYGAQYLETDKHSPGRFRVIGPFSNNPDFSADFNCPLGSTMNPVKKCSVW